ncbi:MAG: hypothetical protein AMJ43_04660 [Coxiella sp. DG_40]|nr:MAG: hypothetical protein AMJ43_04660 [Coxiella sp. DG_40]
MAAEHEENDQKYDESYSYLKWCKLLYLLPASMAAIFGTVTYVYFSKGDTDKFGKVAIGAGTGCITGLITAASTLGLCFFKNRHSSSQIESDENSQSEKDTTTMTVNP